GCCAPKYLINLLTTQDHMTHPELLRESNVAFVFMSVAQSDRVLLSCHVVCHAQGSQRTRIASRGYHKCDLYSLVVTADIDPDLVHLAESARVTAMRNITEMLFLDRSIFSTRRGLPLIFFCAGGS
ncbi:unnamed protein product, partial [Scytosiphon promiscuus]